MKKWLKRIGLGVVGLVLVAVVAFGYMRKANDKDIPAAVKTTVLADQDIRDAIKGPQGKTGDTGKAGPVGEKGEKGEPGAPGEAGKPGANCYDGIDDQNGDGVVDVKDCVGKDGTAVAKIPPVLKSVKKAPLVAKKVEPALTPVVKAPEPATEPTPRIQVYQPVCVVNGEPVKGEKADKPAKEPRTSPLDGITITNNGTMVLAPMMVEVGQ